MTAPGDIGGRNLELEDLLGDGDDEEFFRKLIDFARDFGSEADGHKHDSLMLSAEYRRISRRERNRTESTEVIDLNWRQLVSRGLELKEDILNRYDRAA